MTIRRDTYTTHSKVKGATAKYIDHQKLWKEKKEKVIGTDYIVSWYHRLPRRNLKVFQELWRTLAPSIDDVEPQQMEQFSQLFNPSLVPSKKQNNGRKRHPSVSWYRKRETIYCRLVLDVLLTAESTAEASVLRIENKSKFLKCVRLFYGCFSPLCVCVCVFSLKIVLLLLPSWEACSSSK